MSHAFPKDTVFQSDPHMGLPVSIVRGEDQDLTVNWYINEIQYQNLTAGNFTLKQGGTILLDAPVTSLGPSAGYSAQMTLLAAVTQGQPLGTDYLIIWRLTRPGHPPVDFRRAAYLVRTELFPMASDADLVARHSRLDDLLPPGQTSWADYRSLAWEILNRDLIKKGRRPELVLDSFALIDAHVFKSLELIFRDLSTLVGDGRYTEFAILYGEAYVNEWEVIQFRYDRDEDDAIDPGELESGSPSLWLGVPPGFPSSVVKGG